MDVIWLLGAGLSSIAVDTKAFASTCSSRFSECSRLRIVLAFLWDVLVPGFIQIPLIGGFVSLNLFFTEFI